MRVLTIGFILLFGISALWIASSTWGIGYDPDSIIYKDVAENWLSGEGISRYDFATGERYPMSNFPPFYPLTLGILSQAIGSVAGSARLLNTVLWGVLWLLVYAWIQRGNNTPIIAWMSASLLMLNLFIFQVFGTSWSEPLFLVLGFSGLWLFASYHAYGRTRYLLGASILFACAILTRYAGVALVMTVGVMLLKSDAARHRRLKDIAILGLLSGIPLLIWIGRNLLVRGDVAARDVQFTLIGLPQLQSTIMTMGNWLIPIPELSVALIVIGWIATLLGWAFLQVRQQDTITDARITLMRWWIIIYLLFIIVSFMIIDPRIPFNYRILLPAYVGLVIVIGRGLSLHWTTLSRRLRLTWMITVLVLLLINGLLSINWAVIIGRNGQQYSSAVFRQSQILDDLRESLLEDTVLYTNNNFLLHYQTNKAAQTLPPPDGVDWEAWLAQQSDTKPIQIIFFSLLSQRDWESTDQLKSRLPVIVVDESDVVSIYELDRSHE